MARKTRSRADRRSSKVVENPEGIFRTTLSYNEQTMLCYFTIKEGAAIPLHNHQAVQNGYVISGKIKFTKGDGSRFVATPGSAYVFQSNEYHSAEVLEEADVVECFSPMRPEYADA